VAGVRSTHSSPPPSAPPWQGIGADINIGFSWDEPLTVQSACILLAEIKRRLLLPSGAQDALQMVSPRQAAGGPNLQAGPFL
jgi:hypothetical protein